MRYAPVAMALMALCIGSAAFGAANPQFTFPMHGLHPATFTETCATVADINCDTVRPTVDLPAGAVGPGVVYFFVNNHNELKGCQTAFEFAPWSIVFGTWTCQPNSLRLAEPANPGGPDSGLLSVSFNCFVGTELQTIGYMTINMTGSGCITQVLPTGRLFEALDCNLELDSHDGTGINAGRLGSVCVGQGGVDACDAVSPVESATWGSIKAQYK